MLTEVMHRTSAVDPATGFNSLAHDCWTGRRHDGVAFFAPTREELESFSECACTLETPCPKHSGE